MQKIENSNGSAMWIAAPGFDLAIRDEPSGQYTSRRKEAFVPDDGGLNKWEEVPEILPYPAETEAVQEEIAEEKIARLEAELAKLKNQTT